MSPLTSEPGIGRCRCCNRPNVRLLPVRAPDSLPAQSTICVDCGAHLGSTLDAAQRRDRDHVKMWSTVLRERTQAHGVRMQQEAERWEAKLAAKQQELDDRPVNVVFQNLDAGVVEEAAAQRDAAFRSRDVAFSVLSELWMIHRDAGDGKCRCGLMLRRCKSADAIRRNYASLAAWERKQWELERQGRRNFLPEGHPALVDPRWRPGDGYGDSDDAEESA